MRGAAPAAVFAALGDPTRLRILGLVGEGDGLTATALADPAGVSRPAVAKHLAVLEAAGLVARRKQGRDVRYRVEAEELARASSWLEGRAAAWAGRLAALKELAEREAPGA